MPIELSRRLFLKSAAASAALPLLASRVNAAGVTVIDIVSDGDTNITDWWANTLAPMFEKANPGLKLNVVITRANGGNDTVAQRVVAALQTKSDPKVDYFEEFDPRRVPGATESGAFETIDATKIPNISLANPVALETKFVVPYRASQVLLAYNSDKVAAADVPKTWADLVAWIKKNPGQFIYCRPDKGGSGGNFVVRAVHEANGRNPSLFTPDNFNADLAKKLLTPAWDILKDLQPALYDKGSYPAGNNPTLQLFADGAVSMISAWSDMALQGITQGTLPASTKLTQLQDLPFSGGFAFSAIPVQAAHKDASFKLANFMLSPEVQARMIADFGAFPAIKWGSLSADLAAKYKDVASTTMPSFPGGQWSAALNDGWYSNVATQVSRS
ncbi:MAG: extracellular solute-binding protein [Devosia sp.]|nr:extracellular solute-binding protein [Devosia sp.]